MNPGTVGEEKVLYRLRGGLYSISHDELTLYCMQCMPESQLLPQFSYQMKQPKAGESLCGQFDVNRHLRLTCQSSQTGSQRLLFEVKTCATF